jgi:hypothetical protein
MFPFTVLGSPELKGKYDFSYTPTAIKGMAETPLFIDQVCYGLDLRNYDTEKLRKSKKINLQWIMELYKAHPYKEKFFDSKLSKEMGTIEKLIGSGLFPPADNRWQIRKGIRASWEPGLSEYKKCEKIFVVSLIRLCLVKTHHPADTEFISKHPKRFTPESFA